MGWTAAGGCLVTVARPHSWQSATHLAMSHFMYGQVTRLPISRPVALVPGCARLWKVVNSCGQWAAGIGLGWGPLVSQRSWVPPNWTCWRVVLVMPAATVSGHARWALAMAS
jgi:hypothetical protein